MADLLLIAGAIILLIFLPRLARTFQVKPYKDPRLGDCESWSERRLYNAFVRLGYEPICQKKVGPYRLDLAFIRDGMKIDVECDGKKYHSTPKQKNHDRRRTHYLNQRGWNVIRFGGSDINANATRCARMVIQKYDLQPGTSSSQNAPKTNPMHSRHPSKT